MPPEDIRRWLRRSPFRPFRIYILETTSYVVRHPEMVVLRLATAECFLPAEDQPIPLAAREVTIALRHITRLEALPPTAPSGNGQVV